jgi:methylmalonyl-CoA/ethylmalonyl-CoA epimerase
MKHIDHIGIAVKDLDSSIPLFESIMNTHCYKQEVVDSQKITTAFLRTGETKIELLQDGNKDGTIDKFIQKNGEGVHHIAFEVENILEEIERLKNLGFTVLNERPIKGADEKLICFLHPKTTNGVLIELCQQSKPNKTPNRHVL